ncbi:hypothetical protein ACQB60_43305 [Actinomycetota bacterium Odt1-20B]
MHAHGQYLRYQRDAELLAALGTRLRAEVDRTVTVRLPRDLAEAAAAAWARDEREPSDSAESVAEHQLRDQAAELALIGLAVTERGVHDGDGAVVVDLDLTSVAAALRAATEDR